jgi:phthiocerol/phenolphthiocerol synthesis type-I polyketide synthase D
VSQLADLVAGLSPAARTSLASQLAELGTPVPAPDEPIAVIGIGCRLPGEVDSPQEFWDLLRTGADGVVEVPPDRWDVDAYFDPDPQAPGKIPSRWGGFLRDVAGFDAEAFGISPKEAESMDPQQRLLLEVAYEGLAHAAIPVASLRGTRTGVFVGMSSSDYLLLGVERGSPVDAHTSTGNPHSTAVGRISYLLDARGPCLAVDTACSSSLVAVHLACQSLRLGESDTALAGGVHLILSPLGSLALAKWSMLSPDGRCKAFDARADGFVRGEGCGIVVLRRLSDAQRDGNRVLAVIRGSAVNSDGRSNGLTAPNGAAQRTVIADALRQAAVAPGSVALVETHGTGTSLGDPIEFDAVSQIYGEGEGRCALGAVKTNLGHLEAAAGVTGLIKTVLSLHHGQIPPNLHFTRWNPALDPDGTRLFVPTALSPWPVSGGPRRAAVSAFGFGGTNAHLVLEQAPLADTRHVWVFPGQGAQWAGMGQRLMKEETAFAQAVADLDDDFRAEAGFSLADALTSGTDPSGIAQIQPLIFGFQVALARMWLARGHRPAAVIGHSMGEVAAAVVTGALTAAEGIQVIARRSRLLATISGSGAMAVVGLGAGEAASAAEGLSQVDVAVHLSPTQCVVAGDPDQVGRLVDSLTAQGVFARPVAVDVASHTRQVDPLLELLTKELADLAPAVPGTRFYSTVTDDEPRYDAAYWVQNLRQPVRFAQAVAAAVADGHRSFIEISPHPVLSETIAENAAGHKVSVTASQLRPPTWKHRQFWLAPDARAPHGSVHPLLGLHVPLPDGRHIFQGEIGTQVLPWLADHRVHGSVVLPAAAYVEMVIAAGTRAMGVPAAALAVTGLQLSRLLPLEEHTRVTTSLDPETGRVDIHSLQGGEWVEHASAQVQLQPAGWPPLPPTAGGRPGPATEVYARLRSLGQEHGPAFAAITGVLHSGDDEAVVEIALPAEAGDRREYSCHPVLLDAALQALVAICPPKVEDDVTFLPAEIGQVRVLAEAGERVRAQVRLRRVDEQSWSAQADLTNLDGSLVATMSGIYIRRVGLATVPTPLARRLFGVAWEASRLPETQTISAASSWVIAAGDPGEARVAELAALLTETGDVVQVVPLDDDEELRSALSYDEAQARPPLRGLVVLAGRSTLPIGPVDDVLAAEQSEGILLRCCAVSDALTSSGAPTPPRLWLVTDGGVLDPLSHVLRALVRVLAYEIPQIRASQVCFDTISAASLAAEIRGDGPQDEVSWRDGERLSASVVRVPVTGDGPPRVVVRPGASYVITGGLGGLGLVTAEWLVSQGAGAVVLNGRSAPSADTERALVALRGRGAEVHVVLGDISDGETARRCVAAAEEGGRELRGVVHGAAVLDDRTVPSMTAQACRRVWRPKAWGAWHLHQACDGRPLDFFAIYSSAASILGSPGQAAYAAANGWVDALVGWRQSLGLPATALNWGPWAEVGLARDQHGQALEPMTTAEGLEALAALLSGDRSQTVVARLVPHRILAAFPHLSEVPFFHALGAEVRGLVRDDDWSGPEGLSLVSPQEASRRVRDRLRARIAAVMGFEASEVNTSAPLTSLGMDSLLAVRIRNSVAEDFSLTLPLALVLQGVSLDELAAEICRELAIDDGVPQAGGSELNQARSRGSDRAERLRTRGKRTTS